MTLLLYPILQKIRDSTRHLTWTAPATQELYDKYLPGWRDDPNLLRRVPSIPSDDLWRVHRQNKAKFFKHINCVTGATLDEDVLTIGFARRAADYKRARLIFSAMEKLEEIAGGKVQIVFAGKAHPEDSGGKDLIKGVVKASEELRGVIPVIYLENYNVALGRLITTGVDVWLNTPLRPNEASGTSGMKAALNGIPNLSVLDGWWAEGCRHGENGWTFGDPDNPNDVEDAAHLYEVLEKEVIPTYYNDWSSWCKLMQQSIITAADFTSQRMVGEYCDRYYRISQDQADGVVG